MSSGRKATREELRRYMVILRCQAGDEKAFEWLYERFQDRTRRYLEGILEGAGVMDVQQEVWLTVYRKISQLDNPGGFKTWLYRLTRNKAMDHLRSQRRYSELIESASRERLFSTQFWETEIDGGAEINLEELKSAVDRLSPVHQEVVLLKYWEGMRYEEMAVIIGCPVGTVRSRIYYARKCLQEMLRESPEGSKNIQNRNQGKRNP